jgi:hypothetical protein
MLGHNRLIHMTCNKRERREREREREKKKKKNATLENCQIWLL